MGSAVQCACDGSLRQAAEAEPALARLLGRSPALLQAHVHGIQDPGLGADGAGCCRHGALRGDRAPIHRRRAHRRRGSGGHAGGRGASSGRAHRPGGGGGCGGRGEGAERDGGVGDGRGKGEAKKAAGQGREGSRQAGGVYGRIRVWPQGAADEAGGRPLSAAAQPGRGPCRGRRTARQVPQAHRHHSARQGKGSCRSSRGGRGGGGSCCCRRDAFEAPERAQSALPGPVRQPGRCRSGRSPGGAEGHGEGAGAAAVQHRQHPQAADP
mmetsp:Transcript_3744/g.10810  ORF Transcript_3744/g.10810 Transcript_3744/m.10810 type:complete len:268 (-) Transcript_3744:2279-3082(-)